LETFSTEAAHPFEDDAGRFTSFTPSRT